MEVSKAGVKMDMASLSQKTAKRQADLNKQSNQADYRQKKQDADKNLADLVEKLNKQMHSLDTSIRFAYSDKIASMYISVIEKNTGKEIRKIPSEEAMSLTEHFRDAIGMIFNKEG